MENGFDQFMNFSNILMLFMLMMLAMALCMLSDPTLRENSLQQRVRMFKVLLYLSSLILATGLMEIFLLYAWWFGNRAANSVVLGSGILYSGLMIILFSPTAGLLHRLAVVAQKHCEDSPDNRENMPALSPLVGIGQYVAIFLPAMLGAIPSLIYGG